MSNNIDYEIIREIMREEAQNAAEIAMEHIPTTIISKVAKETTKETITEVMLLCGIDIDEPLEMQKLMSYAKECKDNAPKTKKVIEWGEKTMESGKIFKTNFIAEAAKHLFTVIVALFIVWVGSIKGIWGK